MRSQRGVCGCRRSRDWIIEEVESLRIIDDALWQALKKRQVAVPETVEYLTAFGGLPVPVAAPARVAGPLR